MESLIIIAGIVIVTILSAYGYYLTFAKEQREFEEKKEMKTRYRTNEEFIKS